MSDATMADATKSEATKSEATKSEATIESVLQEQRVFQPPAALAATARIGSMVATRPWRTRRRPIPIPSGET